MPRILFMTGSSDLDIVTTVEDMQISSKIDTDPYTADNHKLRLSRQGKKKTIIFQTQKHSLDIEDLSNEIKNINEEYSFNLIFECVQCGDIYKSDTEPYKCECGSKKFEIKDHNTISKPVGDAIIYIYYREGEHILELTTKENKSSLHFKEASRHLEDVAEALQKIGDNIAESTEESEADDIEIDESQRNQIRDIKESIEEVKHHDKDSAEIKDVFKHAESKDIAPEKTKELIEKLKREGELFEVEKGVIRKI